MKEKDIFFSKAERIFSENSLFSYLKEEILEKFYLLTSIMLETNEKMNITAITDIDSVIARHYADSLLLLNIDIKEGASICDIGCGGGFPTFPIAIARPDLKITSIDSTAKKIAYVNETAKKLGLSNINAISGRAEEFCFVNEKNKEVCLREKFDIATARAVASLPVLCELCLPFVKVGGSFISLKAKTADEEIKASENAISVLGGKTEKIIKLNLKDEPDEEKIAERTLIEIKKVKKTAQKYPRQYSQIKKKPL